MIAEVVERYKIEPKFAVKYLKKKWESVRELGKARDAILNIGAIENLKIVGIDYDVFGIALEYSGHYGLLSNDAIHLATMKKHGITSIATNDRDFERVEWLNIRKP
ncbi:MAG: PIN domain-containing protein [Methanosarcinales archaeon]|nr:PIN domain-containing protein [Methanosarcinales archaeon]